MNIKEAKQSLDKIIEKARVHLYKPIQIAEILYQHRTKCELDLLDLEQIELSLFVKKQSKKLSFHYSIN
jgi:hypothetical protein